MYTVDILLMVNLTSKNSSIIVNPSYGKEMVMLYARYSCLVDALKAFDLVTKEVQI